MSKCIGVENLKMEENARTELSVMPCESTDNFVWRYSISTRQLQNKFYTEFYQTPYCADANYDVYPWVRTALYLVPCSDYLGVEGMLIVEHAQQIQFIVGGANKTFYTNNFTDNDMVQDYKRFVIYEFYDDQGVLTARPSYQGEKFKVVKKLEAVIAQEGIERRLCVAFYIADEDWRKEGQSWTRDCSSPPDGYVSAKQGSNYIYRQWFIYQKLVRKPCPTVYPYAYNQGRSCCRRPQLIAPSILTNFQDSGTCIGSLCCEQSVPCTDGTCVDSYTGWVGFSGHTDRMYIGAVTVYKNSMSPITVLESVSIETDCGSDVIVVELSDATGELVKIEIQGGGGILSLKCKTHQMGEDSLWMAEEKIHYLEQLFELGHCIDRATYNIMFDVEFIRIFSNMLKVKSTERLACAPLTNIQFVKLIKESKTLSYYKITTLLPEVEKGWKQKDKLVLIDVKPGYQSLALRTLCSNFAAGFVFYIRDKFVGSIRIDSDKRGNVKLDAECIQQMARQKYSQSTELFSISSCRNEMVWEFVTHDGYQALYAGGERVFLMDGCYPVDITKVEFEGGTHYRVTMDYKYPTIRGTISTSTEPTLLLPVETVEIIYDTQNIFTHKPYNLVDNNLGTFVGVNMKCSITLELYKEEQISAVVILSSPGEAPTSSALVRMSVNNMIKPCEDVSEYMLVSGVLVYDCGDEVTDTVEIILMEEMNIAEIEISCMVENIVFSQLTGLVYEHLATTDEPEMSQKPSAPQTPTPPRLNNPELHEDFEFLSFELDCETFEVKSVWLSSKDEESNQCGKPVV